MISLDEVKKLRKELIFKGKSQGKFRHLKNKIPKNPKLKEKYCNPNDIDNSGAIMESDVEVLYELITEHKPKTIIEIGSWFGTSAMVMDRASDGQAKIYTCDMHNVYAYDSPNVEYHNCMGTDFLKMLIKKGVKADMAFMDARMMEGDDRRLLKLMNTPFVFSVHDYVEGKKGYAYIHAINKHFPASTIVKPSEASVVAYMEIK